MSDEHGAHKTDKAWVISTTEDFCKSPIAPTGYMICQQLTESLFVCSSVNGCGTPVLNLCSRISCVKGNESGCGGGLVSGVNVGMCKAISNYAGAVRSETHCILRHDTIMEMNMCGANGPGNTFGKIIYLETKCSSRCASQSELDAAKARKRIKDALTKSKGNIDKAHEDIQSQRQANQLSSDDKSLIYAHYWLKGAGLKKKLGKTVSKFLGASYLKAKEYGIGFDELSQEPGKPEPSNHDANTKAWYEAGVDDRFP